MVDMWPTIMTSVFITPIIYFYIDPNWINTTDVERYIISLYWAVTTVTTVG